MNHAQITHCTTSRARTSVPLLRNCWKQHEQSVCPARSVQSRPPAFVLAVITWNRVLEFCCRHSEYEHRCRPRACASLKLSLAPASTLPGTADSPLRALNRHHSSSLQWHTGVHGIPSSPMKMPFSSVVSTLAFSPVCFPFSTRLASPQSPAAAADAPFAAFAPPQPRLPPRFCGTPMNGSIFGGGPFFPVPPSPLHAGSISSPGCRSGCRSSIAMLMSGSVTSSVSWSSGYWIRYWCPFCVSPR
mmetsp:Transcript_615/g.1389  ORF Transcript_615/g.1389 Transcript_615/m.1389 type:complete len:245 (-) Transcript_615:907-1641(-)